MTFPPPPASHIDWANFGLGNQPTVNGHVESRYHASTKTWSPPQFIADPHIRVHGLCPGLNYGQQVYEGLKAFRSSAPGRRDRIAVFRPDYHAARLAHSAAFVSLPAPPAALFRACVRLAVARNAEFVPPAPTTDGFLYVRPLLFGAGPQLLLAPPDEVVFAVYVAPAGAPYHGGGARGLDALVCEEFDRAAPRGTGSAKVGGNYAPVWRHQARAKELGYGITLHLDSKTGGFVEEFSTSGFLGVSVEEGGRKRVLHVPRTENAIRSATSDSIVRLAQREGWTVRREEIPFSALGNFSEVLAVGTAAAAVPIRSISRNSTGEKFFFEGSSGKPGTNSEGLQLARMMGEIQRGIAEDEFGWCWEVEDSSSPESTTAEAPAPWTLSSVSQKLFGIFWSS